MGGTCQSIKRGVFTFAAAAKSEGEHFGNYQPGGHGDSDNGWGRSDVFDNNRKVETEEARRVVGGGVWTVTFWG